MSEPIKCPDCSTWWRGDEHRCPVELTPGTLQVITQRVATQHPYSTGANFASTPPYCSICHSWHIPGSGPCTATYS